MPKVNPTEIRKVLNDTNYHIGKNCIDYITSSTQLGISGQLEHSKSQSTKKSKKNKKKNIENVEDVEVQSTENRRTLHSFELAEGSMQHHVACQTECSENCGQSLYQDRITHLRMREIQLMEEKEKLRQDNVQLVDSIKTGLDSISDMVKKPKKTT